ncbi:hypothetical protein R1sor_000410 [Riccia sorocarpa]|uniref:Diaminopimelate epimerase n=1 Tax=Riccia sorocarpa TaxID=122646 RepID=A0ABD3GTV1_9MARC
MFCVLIHVILIVASRESRPRFQAVRGRIEAFCDEVWRLLRTHHSCGAYGGLPLLLLHRHRNAAVLVFLSGKIGLTRCMLKSNLVLPKLRRGRAVCIGASAEAMVADLKTNSTAPEAAASEDSGTTLFWYNLPFLTDGTIEGIRDEGTTEQRSYKIDTLAGLTVPELMADGQVNRICKSANVYSLPLAEIGPLVEKNEVFPARINTGPTLACGTGACVLVVAAVLEGRAERNCLVELPGGPLQIEWRESDNHVYITGPAQIAFRGTRTYTRSYYPAVVLPQFRPRF